MRDDVSCFILECLIHAAEYRYAPQSADNPDAQQHLHAMELRWLDLATNYEFADRVSRYTRTFVPNGLPLQVAESSPVPTVFEHIPACTTDVWLVAA